MSTRQIQAGTTNVSVNIHIVDSSAGTPITTASASSTGIDLWYRREGAGSTDITESNLASLSATHSDGGIIHINDGAYRLDLPDAACSSGVTGVQIGGTITNMVVLAPYIELVAYDPYDVTRLGLTALPNANADASGGLPISDAGGLDLDQMASDITATLADTNELQADDYPARFADLSGQNVNILADTSSLQDADLSGSLDSIKADTSAALVDTAELQTDDIPGRLDTISGSIAGITPADASATADAVWDRAQSAHTSADSMGAIATELATVDGNVDSILADTGTDGVVVGAFTSGALSEFFTIDTGQGYGDGVSGSVVVEIADNAGGSSLTEAGIADAVWDELQSGHTSAGTFGEVATEIASILDDTDDLSASIATAQTDITAILADTSSMQDADLSGNLDTVIGYTSATLDDTNELQADDYPARFALISAQNVNILADTSGLQDADLSGSLDAILADTSAAAVTLGTLSSSVNSVLTDTDGLRLQSNTAFTDFPIIMYSDSDHITPLTGATVTGTVSLDGGAFAALNNAVSEVSNGLYVVDLDADDVNASTSIVLRFTATDADDVMIPIIPIQT